MSATTLVGTGNPQVPQGLLNRVRASVVIPNFPNLNVTAPFLGKGGVTMTLEGQTTGYIETMTGAVLSPQVYQMVSCVVNLIKTQSIAALYKAQMEAFSPIGNFNVITDTASLPNYNILNGSIESLRELNLSGDDAGFVITLRGYYNINNNLFNLA